MDESESLGKILNTIVIPGKKVCISCKIRIFETLRDFQKVEKDEIQHKVVGFDSPDLELRGIEENVIRENLLAKFNKTLGLYDLTPAANLPRYLVVVNI